MTAQAPANHQESQLRPVQFEALLERELLRQSAAGAEVTTGAAAATKRPFLKRGAGLRRFRLKPGQLRPPAARGRGAAGKSAGRVVLRSAPRGFGPGRPAARGAQADPAAGGFHRDGATDRAAVLDPADTLTSVGDIRVSDICQLPSLRPANSSAVGEAQRVGVGEARGVGEIRGLPRMPALSSRHQPPMGVGAQQALQSIGLRPQRHLPSAAITVDRLDRPPGAMQSAVIGRDAPTPVRKERQELTAFELLEAAAADSSFNSTSSFVSHLLHAASSTPERCRPGKVAPPSPLTAPAASQPQGADRGGRGQAESTDQPRPPELGQRQSGETESGRERNGETGSGQGLSDGTGSGQGLRGGTWSGQGLSDGPGSGQGRRGRTGSGQGPSDGPGSGQGSRGGMGSGAPGQQSLRSELEKTPEKRPQAQASSDFSPLVSSGGAVADWSPPHRRVETERAGSTDWLHRRQSAADSPELRLEQYRQLRDQLRRQLQLQPSPPQSPDRQQPDGRRSVRFHDQHEVFEITADSVLDATLTSDAGVTSADVSPADGDSDVPSEWDVSAENGRNTAPTTSAQQRSLSPTTMHLESSSPQRPAASGASGHVLQRSGVRSEAREVTAQPQRRPTGDPFTFDRGALQRQVKYLNKEVDTFQRENAFISKLKEEVLQQKVLMEKQKEEWEKWTKEEKEKITRRLEQERSKLADERKVFEKEKKRWADDCNKRESPELAILRAKVAELETQLRRRDDGRAADMARLRARAASLARDNERLGGLLREAQQQLARQNARQFSGGGATTTTQRRAAPRSSALSRHRSAPDLVDASGSSSSVSSAGGRAGRGDPVSAAGGSRRSVGSSVTAGSPPVGDERRLVTSRFRHPKPQVRVVRNTPLEDPVPVPPQSAPPAVAAEEEGSSELMQEAVDCGSAGRQPRSGAASERLGSERPGSRSGSEDYGSAGRQPRTGSERPGYERLNSERPGSRSGGEDRAGGGGRLPASTDSVSTVRCGSEEEAGEFATPCWSGSSESGVVTLGAAGRTERDTATTGTDPDVGSAPQLVTPHSTGRFRERAADSTEKPAPAEARTWDLGAAEAALAGSVETPAGRRDKLSDGTVRVCYHNGDWKETGPLGDTVYFYAESGARHTTYRSGAELLQFKSGQTERRDPDGTTEIRYPCGAVTLLLASGEQQTVYKDGTRRRQLLDGSEEILLPSGKLEVHTSRYKKLVCPDGAVKFMYPDGRQETRYPSGRIRIRDGEGRLVVDTQP